jgi:type IV secretory pathway VirB6-like protein
MKWLLILVLCMVTLPATHGYAQTSESPGTCSNEPQFKIPTELLSPGSGLISQVMEEIEYSLGAAGGNMYDTIVTSPLFEDVIPIVIVLYLIIYSVLFMFGMVQISLFDLMVRLIKIGIIAGIASWGIPGYGDLYGLLDYFFTEGTNAIISEVVAIAASISNVPDPAHPFLTMDIALAKIISPQMVVTLLAVIFTPPYGLIFGLLLVLSMGSFLKALFTAIWVYLMALVLRTFLLGLAPIFIVFILFERTRHLFTGWLNQLINTCLQPIMLLMFFAFFITLIEVSLSKLLANPVCLTLVPELWRGGPENIFLWRFAIRDGQGGWKPFSGDWTFFGAETGGGGATGEPFPIDIMYVLILFMLAELAGRFNAVVLMIAKDLAGASTDLAVMQTPWSNMFSPSSARKPSPINTKSTGPGGAGEASERLRQQDETRNKNVASFISQANNQIQKTTNAINNLRNPTK